MATSLSSPLTSPTTSPALNSQSQSQVAHLDHEILRVRAEIARLREEKQSLSTALLASSTVRTIVEGRRASKLRERNGQQSRDGGVDTSIGSGNEDTTYDRLERAVDRQQMRNDLKFYRLVNNVTAFPFTDPAPERRGEASMLGLRFEMPRVSVGGSTSYTGIVKQRQAENRGDQMDIDMNMDNYSSDSEHTQNQTYLIMLRRISHRGKQYLQFQEDMNQVPKHIDVEGLAERYLHIPEEALETSDNHNQNGTSSVQGDTSFQDDSGIDVTQDLTQMLNNTNTNTNSTGLRTGSTNTTTNIASNPNQNSNTSNQAIDVQNTGQSLTSFTNAVRNALLSWTYRQSHIIHLERTLRIQDSHQDNTSTSISKSITTSTSKSQPKYAHSITHISSPTPSATQLRIDWCNAATALLGLNDSGHITIARVFGPKMFEDDEEISTTAASASAPALGGKLGGNNGDGGGAMKSWRCHEVERRLTDAGGVARGSDQCLDESGKVGIWALEGRLREIGRLMG